MTSYSSINVLHELRNDLKDVNTTWCPVQFKSYFHQYICLLSVLVFMFVCGSDKHSYFLNLHFLILFWKIIPHGSFLTCFHVNVDECLSLDTFSVGGTSRATFSVPSSLQTIILLSHLPGPQWDDEDEGTNRRTGLRRVPAGDSGNSDICWWTFVLHLFCKLLSLMIVQ